MSKKEPIEFRSPFAIIRFSNGTEIQVIPDPVWQRRLARWERIIDSGIDPGDAALLGSIQSPPPVGPEQVSDSVLLSGGPPSAQSGEAEALAMLLGAGAPQTLFGPPIRDTRANRANYPAAAYRLQFYVETDTESDLVYQSDGTDWLYVTGVYRDVLADILTGLGAADTNLLFEVTDYDHVLRWDGAAWGWGTGNPSPSGIYGLFETAPTTTGWQICDGSTVDRLNADATVTPVTVPNVGTAAYLKGGTSAAAVAAAGGVSAGTVATNQATTATNQATVVGAHAVVDDLAAGVGNAVFSTPGDAAHASHNHTQDSHNHTQDSHTHGPGSLELRNKQGILYYRR